MTAETETQQRRRKWPWIALGTIALLLAALLLPPKFNMYRYRGQIAQMVSQSLGRPVHISGVEPRLLPWPGLVLSNLVVDEDPAFGAEPVLHADTVAISFRFLALWRGRFEISTISVDNASLNIVRMPNGKWNLDSLFRTAAAKAGAVAHAPAHHAVELPYLEATESRVNFKNGVEKLPFSIVNADIAFWQGSPGDWHIRLRGQPARTDLSLDQEDTGIVRINASLHSAPALRDMPLRIDMDWRQAQLGQLSRLLIGSDPGWRGALTANLHLEGTPDTARISARLRATGVHRYEFAPAEPLDFDANCGFVYHYSRRALNNLVCNSPLGNGSVRLTGDMPGSGAQPTFTVALDKIPVDAGLAFLRTIRSNIDPDLNAAGSISGKVTYAGQAQQALKPTRKVALNRRIQAQPPAPAPLTGSFTVNGFQLSGGPLNNPIQVAHVVFEPEETGPGQSMALSASAAIPAGAATPLTFIPRITLQGYQLTVSGPASLSRARQLAGLAGIANPSELNALSGGPALLALNIEGPWLPQQQSSPMPPEPGNPNHPQLPLAIDPGQPATPSVDDISGTITLHDAHWKPEYLAHRVNISDATLLLANGEARWDPVNFSFGPLKATASLTLPTACSADKPCPTHFQMQFGHLKAAELQTAVLGARPQVSLFDALIDRLHLSSAPAWPPLQGTVRAASLALGPITLEDPVATLEIDSNGAKITSLDGKILGGHMHADGTFTRPGTDQGRPVYALHAIFSRLSAPAVGRLVGMRFSGSPLDATGRIQLTGVTVGELAASAKGTLHFDWSRGSIAALPEAGPRKREKTKPLVTAAPIPPQLARFTRLTGEAEIANGKVSLRNTEVFRGRQHHPVEAEVKLDESHELTFPVPPPIPAKEDTSTHTVK